MILVYEIINKLNGKRYIGQTTSSLKDRFLAHCRNKKVYFSKVLKEEGKENFFIKELTLCNNRKEANILEEYYINLYNSFVPNGYNIRHGGINGKHADITKEKLVKLRTGSTASIKTKQKISARMKGNTFLLGHKHSEETKAKMSKSRTGKIQSEETKRKRITSRLKTLAMQKVGV